MLIAEFRRGLLVATLALVALAVVFIGRAAAQEESAGQYWTKEAARHPATMAVPRGGKRPRQIRAVDGHPVADLITAAARRHGVPVALAHGVARVESGYRCHARSHANARGAMQVLPATARSVGIHGNLYDCATGIEAGMRYLRLVIARGGAGCAGVSLYERGLYARPVCTGYGRKVMRLASA